MAETGSGTGTPVASTVTGVAEGAVVGTTCVTYARSLEILNIDNKAGAYGYLNTDFCDVVWKAFQREGWISALEQAQSEIERDLGAPLCPKQICGERHQVGSTIQLKQAPVAYLGQKTYSAWTEAALTDDGDFFYVEICEADLPEGLDSDDVEFSYPDAVLDTYTGKQALQAPVVSTVSNCNGTGEDGFRFTWPVHQLVDPNEDSMQVSETEKLIDDVKWRTFTIDADLAYEVVGYCGCASCKDEDPNYTLTLCDEESGLVCLEEQGTVCQNNTRQIRLNYGAAFNCEGTIAPDVERALVLVALVNAQHTASKPCGCDNSHVDDMLALDPSAKTDFATKLSYGPTVAGMTAMRILDKYEERPHYNTQIATGGMLTHRSLTNKNRYGG